MSSTSMNAHSTLVLDKGSSKHMANIHSWIIYSDIPDILKNVTENFTGSSTIRRQTHRAGAVRSPPKDQVSLRLME